MALTVYPVVYPTAHVVQRTVNRTVCYLCTISLHSSAISLIDSSSTLRTTSSTSVSSNADSGGGVLGGGGQHEAPPPGPRQPGDGALLRAGLVDEVNIEFLPAVIGGLNTASLFDSPALKADEQPTRLKLICCQVQAGGRVWLRYEVVRE